MRVLASDGPLNIHAIAKRLGFEGDEYQTVTNTVRRLQADGVIHVVEKKRGARGPRNRKIDYFNLTRTGISELVHNATLDEDYPVLRELTRKQRDFLPTIFDLWPMIVEAGVEDLAAAAVKGLLDSPTGERLELNFQLQAAHQRALEYFVNAEYVTSEYIALHYHEGKMTDADLEHLETLEQTLRNKWNEALRGSDQLRAAREQALRRTALRRLRGATRALEAIAAERITFVNGEEKNAVQKELERLALAVKMLEDL